MHPLRERACDHLLEHPLLRTPPPEPERPRPPRVRKPREFKLVSYLTKCYIYILETKLAYTL